MSSFSGSKSHANIIILQTISCVHIINKQNFKDYCLKTAKLYVQKYDWYYMPICVRKLLIHGTQIVEHALLPIGQMSEEAQKLCYK